MHLYAMIGFVAFGTLSLSIAIWHEYSWWRRRHWRSAKGVIVGYSERRGDGESYHPEIEFEGASGLIKFVSIYGSGTKLIEGSEVEILVDDSRGTAVHVSASNRLVFTLVPIIFSVIFFVIGFAVKT